MEFNKFKDILNAIISKKIDYGRKGEYYLYLTEDRNLYFLQRNNETPLDGFDNEYAGDSIWEASCVDWETYDMFMKALGIETNT